MYQYDEYEKSERNMAIIFCIIIVAGIISAFLIVFFANKDTYKITTVEEVVITDKYTENRTVKSGRALIHKNYDYVSFGEENTELVSPDFFEIVKIGDTIIIEKTSTYQKDDNILVNDSYSILEYESLVKLGDE